MHSKKHPPKHCNSLRHGLRNLLRCKDTSSSPQHLKVPTVGSGILRRADKPPTQLPLFSSMSLFPDFASSQFDVNLYGLSLPDSRPTLPHLSSGFTSSTHSLLPATSLSCFNLHHAFLTEGILPRQIVYKSVPDTYRYGASRHASLATIPESLARPSASALRVQDTSRCLNATNSSSPHQETRPQSAHQNCLDRNLCDLPQGVWTGSEAGFEHRAPRIPDITTINHFKCFCVLDTAVQGFPVTATSEELRYIFDVGEPFFLNNQECVGTSMDIVTGADAAGNPVTHLVLFSPLVAPSSGRSRFLLASLVDVTEFINEAAALPDLDSISEEISINNEALLTPPINLGTLGWCSTKNELSAEDLLRGCYLREHEERLATPSKLIQNDVWVNLATEENLRRPGAWRHGSRHAPTPPSVESSITTDSAACLNVDEVLEDFVSRLQGLYSNFFLLGKSPLADIYYEICNVSPTVYADREYINGHLSHSSPTDIDTLSLNLAQGLPFNMAVKWGMQGEDKQMYCIPLFGQRSLTWICLLVDCEIPMLW